MRYGNRNEPVEPGHLATFASVRGDVKVVVDSIVRDHFHNRTRVRVKVTEHSHPLYDRGDHIDVSPTWLTRRSHA